jgi:hypothetical protein
MAENKTLTPAEVAEKDKKKAERKALNKTRGENRNKAFDTLKALVEKSADDTAKKALATIRPSIFGVARVAGTGNISIATRFVNLIVEKKTISEDEVFKMLKVGRKDCSHFIKRNLQKVAPEERVWINFDKEKGIYTMVGKGAIAPATYTGAKPSEQAVNLK